MIDFSNALSKNNVVYLCEYKNTFSQLYVAVRDKEKRILSDNEVKQLPYLNRNDWAFRVKSTKRFLNYIASKETDLRILDIGCGNGWFSNKMVNLSQQNYVIGLDINSQELEQAARVFKAKNLTFVYGDIFEIINAFKKQFDIITLNASVQYFKDFKVLITTLKSCLKTKGEIHIIDSPFYKPSEIVDAKKRTLDYYTNLGFPEMATNYFHHSIEDTNEFEVLYKNGNRVLKKILNLKDSPFPWLHYVKN